MKGTCGEVVGLILLVNTVLTAMISIPAPFWIEDVDSHSGLIAVCKDECVWYFENDFHVQKNLPVWFHATQGLMSTGLVLGLTALIISIASLCCTCHSCNPHRPISGLILLSCTSMAAGIIVFGVKANDDWNIEWKKGSHKWFSWAFWVGTAAAAMALLATFIFLCIAKKQNND